MLNLSGIKVGTYSFVLCFLFLLTFNNFIAQLYISHSLRGRYRLTGLSGNREGSKKSITTISDSNEILLLKALY